jgi:hypothetical protein
MSIDSTADLLFRIGANSDDAENNIKRFRTLLSKDLGQMKEEFADWSKGLFGAMNTAAGIATGAGAVLAAGLVAAGAAAIHAADQYTAYVESVERGAKLTGMSVEAISSLKFAAEATGTSFDSLSGGLAIFTRNVVHAAEGSGAQLKAFERLGISQKELQAGEHDMLPLLQSVAEHFSALKDKTERTAEARDLFGRNGTQFLEFLALGKTGLKDMAEEAKRLGLVLTEEDVKILHQAQAIEAETKAVGDAVNIEVGRTTTPLLNAFSLAWANLLKTLAQGHVTEFTLLPNLVKNIKESVDAINKLAAARQHLGNQQLKLDTLGGDKAADEFRGLSSVLETVKERTASAAGGEAKLAGELEHLRAEATKATEEWNKYVAAHKSSPEVLEREGAALQKLPGAIAALGRALEAELHGKQAEAYQQFADDLQRRIVETQQKSLATEVAAWDQEISGLKDHLAKDKTLRVEQKAELLAEIEKLQKAGTERIDREQLEGLEQANEEVNRRIDEQDENTHAKQVAAVDREIETLRRGYVEKFGPSEEYEQKLEAFRAASLAKISKEEAAAAAESLAALKKKLGQEEAVTLEGRHQAHDREMDELDREFRLKAGYETTYQAIIAQIRRDGHGKIDADNQIAFAREKARLDEQLKQIESKDQTPQQRIVSAYLADTEKINAAEKEETAQKSLSEQQRTEIVAKYAALRAAFLVKEQADLQALKNSTGWRGVFGAEFAQQIRGNEALSKEWADGTQRSHMLVRMSLESLKETGQQAFGQLAQGMGGAIAQSLVYSKSFGEAMKQAAVSTLESISAQSLVQAIYSTAWGFFDLATGDYEGAASAFEAAALFGSVGVAAGVAGRAMAPKRGGASAPGAGAAGSGGAGASEANTGAGGANGGASAGKHFTFNFYGHIVGQSGAAELCNILSDAVVNTDAKLTATDTRTGRQVTR